jgi:hypothetical protein
VPEVEEVVVKEETVSKNVVEKGEENENSNDEIIVDVDSIETVHLS